MTLLEVLVGLAILSGVIAGALVARGRAVHQLSESGRRLEALAAADALLTGWWRRPGSFPRRGEGKVSGEDGEPRFLWRTEPVTDAGAGPHLPESASGVEAPGLPRYETVRLSVLDARRPDGEPLAAVEVVLPARQAQRGSDQ